MTPHKWIVILKRLDQRGDGLKALQIPQSHRHIAEKASALGPGNGARAKTAAKLLFAQQKKRNQLRREETLPRIKGLFPGRLRFNVVRTNLLANVAAEDVVAHQRAEMLWNRSLELDRQIRDAAARVEYIMTDKSAGGTCLQAEIALAAPVPDRPVVDQLDA